MSDRDLYADLGVAREASADDIRKACRKLGREHHSDVNPNEPAAEKGFKRVPFAIPGAAVIIQVREEMAGQRRTIEEFAVRLSSANEPRNHRTRSLGR